MKKQMATNTVGDGLAWLMLALGVTFHPHEYLGGLFFAFGCAMLTRHWFPEKNNREVWFTLLTAFLVSTFGSTVFFWWFVGSHLPVQTVMAVLGLFSRVILAVLMEIQRMIEVRKSEIAGKLIDRRIDGDKP
jgi:hypothetical protein